MVAPEHRSRGVGRGLLDAAEAELRCTGLQIGDHRRGRALLPLARRRSRETGFLCLLERARRYARTGANFNMDVDLAAIAADPGGWSGRDPRRASEIGGWASSTGNVEALELVRALDRDTLVITRDAEGIAAVCAYDVNRTGWVGPVAVRSRADGRGVGRAPLLGALHRIRAGGHDRVEIGWVGPMRAVRRASARPSAGCSSSTARSST